jgi:hypothetical protein
MDSTVVVLIVVVVLLLVALAGLGILLSKRKQSERLQQRFGPEYERQLSETGDRKAVESDLRKREQRRSKLDIRDLRPEERDQFEESWDSVQRGFVDDPARALNGADSLVIEIMQVRGYPVDDFDRRADDISVDHPEVVRHYRDAREVHEASAEGSVDTEQQRHALTAYRSLVEALLGRAPRRPDTRRSDTRAGSAGPENGDGDTDHRPTRNTNTTRERT